MYKFLSVVNKPFTCYYFTNLLEVHPGPCTSESFYLQMKRPWMVYIFLLSLPMRLLSGLLGEAASPPIVFTPALLCGFYLTIGFVYFYKVSFQHLRLEFPIPWSFGENLRTTLCYQGFLFLVSVF